MLADRREREGTGNLLEDNEIIANVRYFVTSTEPLCGGLKTISGRIISGLEFGDAFRLVDRGARLTLELDEGVRWDCFLTDRSGRLAACSDFYGKKN